ncbi:MAG TPA: DNA polymerase III subunit beta [Candidatus Paceibacterota bacterium]|nr:DNA polymerase III subunit beta [Candidatus Paceibacterota bacterium]
MKLSTTKNQILNAVLLAERIAGKKESLPVLSCILIDTGKIIVLRSTNLEAGIEITISGSVEEKGVIAVPAAILSQTLRSISSEKLTLRSDEGNLIVESKGTRTLIKAIPHGEFPALPSQVGKKGMRFPREKFLRALQAVVYAASPSMIRPELGSVFVSVKPQGITCVATDSFRLAEKTIPASSGKSDAELLIPLKHAAELSYILERTAEESVEIVAEDTQLVATAGDVRYTSRVVDGQFPNYKDIIPKDTTTEATLLKNDLSDMLKKARVFAGGEQHVGLHVYPKKKIFSATARSSDVGEMSDSIDAALSGEDIDINFHIGYLAECLPSIESDSITLAFAGPGRPLVVKGTSDATFLYLVMPLNR